MSEPHFLFAAPNWTPASAGIRAMHTLCHMLNRMGQRAYLFPCVKNPDFDTPLWTPGVRGRQIAVYPEGIQGNPFGSPVVARWLLYYQGHDFVSAKSDLFFSWTDAFARADAPATPLRVPIIDEAAFYPPAGGKDAPRPLRCYFARKYRASGYIVPEEIERTHVDLDSIAPGDRARLREVLQQSEYVMLFEPSTVQEEVLLCACPTVYANTTMFREPPELSGAAMDTRPESLQRAKDTLVNKCREYMRRKKLAEEQVRRFINLCIQRSES